jgi:Putative 2OG-Fe(II) oxygenase
MIWTNFFPGTEALNARLVQAIERHLPGADTPGGSVTGSVWNRRAYNLFDWDDEAACAELLGKILSVLQKLGHETERVTGWANVSRKGDGNRPHDHGTTGLSGIYYVQTGGEPAGRTRFFAAKDGPEILRLHPVPGPLVVFPSATVHDVEPHAGAGARITIAFNVWGPGEGTRNG